MNELRLEPGHTEILKLLVRGHTITGIAQRLQVSEVTVYERLRLARYVNECDTYYQLVAEFSAEQQRFKSQKETA